MQDPGIRGVSCGPRRLEKRGNILKPSDRKNLRKNLQQAVDDNDLARLAELIAIHGPNVFVHPKGCDSLLHYACYACQEERLDIVRLLIAQGANVNARNTSGATPLHIACFNGRIDSVRTLIDAGANVGAIDTDGLTPFDDICKSRGDVFNETYAEIGDILISNGADIDSFNLHHACRNFQVNVVRFLLSRGTHPTIRDHLDKTPLDIAIDLPQDTPEREEILDLFREFHPELYFSKFCTMDMRP